MSRIDFQNDDTVFDRLVDGELTAHERQELLASLDDPQGTRQDQGWRRCALAFLEAQAWGHQFKQMIAEPATDKASVSFAPSANSARLAGRWLALAAGLLVAFSLGWLTRTPSPLSPQQTLITSNDDSIIDRPTIERHEMPLREDFPEDDVVTLLVRDTSGKHQRLQVPLMEVEDIDDQFGASLPAAMRARLRDRGIDLHRRRRFAPMFFEQDQQLVPMVVPVEDTYAVPVDRPIY